MLGNGLAPSRVREVSSPLGLAVLDRAGLLVRLALSILLWSLVSYC